MRLNKMLISAVLMILLCGCSVNREEQEPTIENKVGQVGSSELDQTSEIDLPSKYQKDIDSNVAFNMPIVVNKEVNINDLKESYAERQKIDYDKAFKVLFKDQVIKEQYEDSVEDEEGNKEDALYYQSEEGYILSLGLRTTFFARPLYYNIMNSFRTYEDELYNADKYATNKNLAFEPHEESYSKIKKVLSQMGIEIDSQYKCYALDYLTMEQEEQAINDKGETDVNALKESWIQEDDCYYFVVKQSYKNIPVFTPLAGIYKEINDDTAPIKILYSKNGIEMLELNEFFSFHDLDEKLNLKSMDDIAETIAIKYGTIITDAKYIVQKAELYYRPMDSKQGKYDLIPTWVIDIEEIQTGEVEGQEINTTQIFINAITAEEIL